MANTEASRINPRTVLFLCLCFTVTPVISSAQASRKDSGNNRSSSATGKQSFTSSCAGCHGLDGRGSERAPSITTTPRIRKFTDQQLSNVISNGVPGTGMPAFHSLTATQVRSLVSYVRLLQGKTENRALPGNPERGKEIYFSKGECSNCHSIAGQGGFLGPDLTTYGSTSADTVILQAILNPNRIVPPGYKSAIATTPDGARIEGIVRNEDNFSVQLQTQDGAFHLLQKSDLQDLEYRNQSIMPTNYGERLNRAELDDLVSYLMDASSSQGKSNSKGAPKEKEDDAQ
ncbi:MAG: c-type cytochrome [Candidatus Sulfotelmatobacter sp.]